VFGGRILQVDDFKSFAGALGIDGLEDVLQFADVEGGIHHQDQIARPEGRYVAILGDHRLQKGQGFLGRDIFQLVDLGHVIFIDRGLFAGGEQGEAGLAGAGNRDDLADLAALHYGEALQFQHRDEDVVGLVRGELGGGVDGDLPLDPVVQHEILAGQVADELHHGGDIHLVEIEHHPFAGGQGRRGGKESCQKQGTEYVFKVSSQVILRVSVYRN